MREREREKEETTTITSLNAINFSHQVVYIVCLRVFVFDIIVSKDKEMSGG